MGIVVFAGKAVYDLSQSHDHGSHEPEYPYLRIRNKDFPWGPDGLFERKHEEH
jgi:cytochrome c oxidase subunit 6a